MLLWLLLGLVRPYHIETVDTVLKSRHTHVQVAGRVVLVRNEADGDVHIRVADEHGHFIVAEIVPYHPLARPRVGQMVVVYGIRRIDTEVNHGWVEVHPVEKIEVVPVLHVRPSLR